MAENQKSEPTTPEQALISWVKGHVDEWEDHRRSEYEDRWDEYYRLWRGEWRESDKTRSSERSKIISPALQQAIEMQVAELEEATFGRDEWFDIQDNYADRRTDFQSVKDREAIKEAINRIQQAVENGQVDQQQAQLLIQQVRQQSQQRETGDVEHMKNLMKENFEQTDVKTSISKIFLNSALYGTGIGKVVASEETTKVYNHDEDPPSVEDKDVLRIFIEPVSPYNFSIDPVATSIEDALGCAHKVDKSKHEVVKKQKDGVYRQVPLETPDLAEESEPPSLEDTEVGDPQTVRITEYWGLVPQSLLDAQEEEDSKEGLEEVLESAGDKIPDVDEDELVEAVVTVANERILLRAENNPFLMEDRPFVAFQHDTVPDTFWGRGVAEKGFNAQKALDGEVRARMDGLALSVHPMMAYDVTSRPRGSNYQVHPGKSIGTTGPPKDALMPFNFGDINSKTFENAADLERMVQQATGSMDSAIPIGQNRRNETASGMSQIQAGAIKRSKRTLQNIEQKLIKKFLKKAAWRFQQFDSDNFPMRDLSFIPHSALGIMARELEQQQMIQLLSVVPQESEAFSILLKAIYSNSSLSNREELIESIENSMQPDPTQQKLQQLQLEEQAAKVQVQQTEAKENQADAFKAVMDARATIQKNELEENKLDVQLMGEVLDVVANSQQQNQQSMTALAQEVIRQRAGQNNNNTGQAS